MTTPASTSAPTPSASGRLVSSQAIGRAFKYGFAALLLLVVIASGMATSRKNDREAEKAAVARKAIVAAAAIVPEITFGCGGEKEYLPLPSVRSLVLVLNPTGDGCSTAWFRKPEKATYFHSDPGSDIKMQMSIGEGEITPWLDDSPLINRFEGRAMNAARYRNLGGSPVRIPITIRY